ncbi:MAG: N-acetylmuramoyl-L-alanine amidase [Selenomonadales bacterium]|nr:N-acetylmuramoyl-L-alanine amidase [Selenomonadales bacterium]
MKKRIALICSMLIGILFACTVAYAAAVEKTEYTVREGEGSTVVNVMITFDSKITEVVPCVVGATESQLRVLLNGAHVVDVTRSSLDGKYAKEIIFQPAGKTFAEAVINCTKSMRIAECRSEVRAQSDGKSIVILTMTLASHGDGSGGIKGKTIILDAGHGGSDCGAVGPSGVYEKDITLAVAKELQKQLITEGANVLMTRTTDRDVSHREGASVSVELGDRIVVAEELQADVFVSIHLNSFTSPDIGGVETYYYQGSLEGERLAYAVQKSLMDQFDLKDRGVKTANFYLLKNSSMPSILTELAFISNPREEQLLISSNAQALFAQAILTGLKQYFSA